MPRVSPLAEVPALTGPERAPALHIHNGAQSLVLVLHLWPPDSVPSGHVVLPGGREPGGAGPSAQIKAAGLGAWAWPDDEREVGHSERRLGLEWGQVSERALGPAIKGVSSIPGESCFLAWQRLLMALCPGGRGRGGNGEGAGEDWSPFLQGW